ncbi:uncharacterized protein LOC123519208 [Portunus trituberculatus]|uniref:uncharacterized protein LOC123519208 n=1 Tax=Portunus trituberculatus TaxID=210409 RepID=UPI001E1CC60D|nr:uncharacterized protein LOC123519208 [Portunus trituberculatus]
MRHTGLELLAGRMNKNFSVHSSLKQRFSASTLRLLEQAMLSSVSSSLLWCTESARSRQHQHARTLSTPTLYTARVSPAGCHRPPPRHHGERCMPPRYPPRPLVIPTTLHISLTFLLQEIESVHALTGLLTPASVARRPATRHTLPPRSHPAADWSRVRTEPSLGPDPDRGPPFGDAYCSRKKATAEVETPSSIAPEVLRAHKLLAKTMRLPHRGACYKVMLGGGSLVVFAVVFVDGSIFEVADFSSWCVLSHVEQCERALLTYASMVVRKYRSGHSLSPFRHSPLLVGSTYTFCAEFFFLGGDEDIQEREAAIGILQG